ncbi:MAG: thiamine diphosphokinase [Anaerolineales bacterium]|nr:thiamine diphosphokinase [Anaerolineales bacterium]
MSTTIVANGELGDPALAREWFERADLTIAADGGLRHCTQLELEPDLLVGDLDSIDPDQLNRLERAGTEVRRHPRRKDATDLELALAEVHERQTRDVVVLGAIGSRWDQSAANLLLAARPDWADMRIRFVKGPQQAEVLRPGRRLTFDGSPNDLVSLIPLAGDAQGITTSGLAYPLERGTLEFAATRGVSNYIERTPASVELEHGLLLTVLIRGGAPAVENKV